jgi:glutamine synthetase adenylyltransferase
MTCSTPTTTVTWPSAWHRLLQRGGDAHPDAAPDILLAPLKAALRAFRRREMVRIAVRDLAGICDLDDTMADLSALAGDDRWRPGGAVRPHVHATDGTPRTPPARSNAWWCSAWESWVPVNSIFPRMWT